MATDGTVAITEQTFGSMKCVAWAWTSGADGGVSGWLTGTPSGDVGVSAVPGGYNGEVSLCATVPGAGGNAPTAYTIQILDNNGLDLLVGAGTARSATTTQYLTKPGGSVANSQLQLVIASAGANKQGTAYIYIR